MWTNAQLKQNAWRILQRDYWMPFLLSFLYSMIVGAANGIVNQIFPINPSGYYQSDSLSWFFYNSFVTMSSVLNFFTTLAVGYLLTNVLEVGLNRFLMENRGRRSDIGVLFSGYRYNFGNVVVVQLLRSLFISLWSLALIVPGIVKGYEYAMIPYLLAENPNMPHQRAFELSRMMTQGYKMDMFLLDLSFIGWYLLGFLPCGLGVFFVVPYHRAALAEQYTAMRTRALALGLTTPYELPGFGY